MSEQPLSEPHETSLTSGVAAVSSDLADEPQILTSPTETPPIELLEQTLDRQTYTLTINPQILKQQQQLLDRLLRVSSQDRELLAGVLRLLQELAQQAYDKYRLDALLVPPAEALAGYIDRQQVSAEELLAAVGELSRRHPDGKATIAAALSQLVPPEQLRVMVDGIIADRVAATAQPTDAPLAQPADQPTEQEPQA